jgi:LysR family transcriptional regulator, glycine cleavage system transcriptional activator
MRLPNLNGLRAFEAAARLLSIKDAAAELHVTPSAVSQLIRGLEAELGASLFHRGHRQLGLTIAGQALLPPLRTGLRLIGEAADQIRREPNPSLLTVSTTAFFAETWLAPRLPQFTSTHADLDVHVTVGVALANLAAGDADVAIRHGLGDYPGMHSELLLAPTVVPVAAPSLVALHGIPASAAALVNWPKVQDGDRGAWALWFLKQGVELSSPVRGPSFDDTGLLRAAALAGHGAALLPAPLVGPLLAAGQLVEVGPPADLDELAYYLVVPRTSLARPKIKAFRNWILWQVGLAKQGPKARPAP